jgi:hypothetical protein
MACHSRYYHRRPHCHIRGYLHSAMHMLRRRVRVLLLSVLHLLLQRQRTRTQARQKRSRRPVPYSIWCSTASHESLCPGACRCAAGSAHRHPPAEPAIPLQPHADLRTSRAARKTAVCDIQLDTSRSQRRLFTRDAHMERRAGRTCPSRGTTRASEARGHGDG